ncbi:AAA family ATPase [Myroides odoratimimus]|uniref:AAA family ATPase n=1 Tax=Myroides odoratimimus TaxID=76832 RepID=UPI0025762FF5|nr:AAA family ATPase [Myroides odoratimimus]MDM1038371.1 hypothetical protein [Myroides odoratimimus]MDM1052656.1 hypothetical protein [Myroides odoratimimus]
MMTQNNNIKLSKIILEAFRGYKDKVTFDFTLPDNKIADIVAIYAPNGFGKTSFFDGIEWNTKGKIERFEENSKIKNSAELFGGAILKNRESNLNNGSVSLFDQQNLHFTRITSNSDKWDLLSGRLDSNNTSPLKNIVNYKTHKRIEILPQSRIDSFLSSKTPEEKYQALLDFWDGNDESDYFVGVSKFYEESEKERVNITIEIEEILEKIAELTTSESKISFFNSLVQDINSNKNSSFNVQQFTENTSETEFEHTVKTINNNTASISSRLSQTELRQVQLITLENGFTLFIKNKELVVNVKNEVGNLQSILNNFSQLDIKKQERKELESKLQKEQKNLDEVKLISLSKEHFLSIIDRIKKLVDERNSITEGKPALLQQKNNKEKEIETKTERLKKILANETKYNENFDNLTTLFNRIEANKKRGASSKHRLSLCKRIKEKRNNIVADTRDEITTIQNILSLKLESFCDKEYTYTEFKNLASEIKNKFKEIVILNEKLKELRIDYGKKGALNANLQKIIELGRDYISQTETNTCPLCNAPQDDFETLLSCISSQKEEVLGLDQSFEKIQSLQTDIENKNNDLDEKYESLLINLKEISSELIDKLAIINSKTLETELLINYYINIETLIDTENKKLNSQYEAIETENDFLKLQLESLEELKESLPQSITESKKQFIDLREKINDSDHQIEKIEAEIKILNQDPTYIEVNLFLEKKSITKSFYVEIGLDKMIDKAVEEVQKLKEKIALLQSEADELIKSTKDKNKDTIQKKLTEKTIELKNIEDKISQYESQYKSIIGKDEIKMEIVAQNLSYNKDTIQDLKDMDVKLRELQTNICFNPRYPRVF